MIELQETKESLLDYKLYCIKNTKQKMLVHKTTGTKYLLCEEHYEKT